MVLLTLDVMFIKAVAKYSALSQCCGLSVVLALDEMCVMLCCYASLPDLI